VVVVVVVVVVCFVCRCCCCWSCCCSSSFSSSCCCGCCSLPQDVTPFHAVDMDWGGLSEAQSGQPDHPPLLRRGRKRLRLMAASSDQALPEPATRVSSSSSSSSSGHPSSSSSSGSSSSSSSRRASAALTTDSRPVPTPVAAQTCSARLPAAPPRPNLADEDVDMMLVSRCISLRDPVSLRRIKSPVRGPLCKHIQAFDRRAYLEFNELMERDRWSKLSKRWKCPFCNSHVGRKDMVEATDLRALIDLSVLEGSRASHALVLPDGTLVLPPTGSANPRLSRPSLSSQSAAVDTSEEEEVVERRAGSRGAAREKAKAATSPPRRKSTRLLAKQTPAAARSRPTTPPLSSSISRPSTPPKAASKGVAAKASAGRKLEKGSCALKPLKQGSIMNFFGTK